MLVEQLKLGDWLLFPIVVGELAFLFLFQTHSQLNDVRALLDWRWMENYYGPTSSSSMCDKALCWTKSRVSPMIVSLPMSAVADKYINGKSFISGTLEAGNKPSHVQLFERCLP